MRDDKGDDDKIVAVAVDDPAVQHYTDVGQLPPHLMIELERFFRDYKVLEAKTTEVDELYGREAALAVMRRSLDAYRSRAGWRKP
jgi:inorganic pyrophosphatase